MHHLKNIIPSVAAAALILSPVVGQARPADPAPAAAAKAGATPMDADAIRALRMMAAYLATLPSFDLKAKGALNLKASQLDVQVTVAVETLYRVQRPNAFFIEMRSGENVERFHYDGDTVTISEPMNKMFATVKAPPRIDMLVDDLWANHGVTLPLAELFYWASVGAPVDAVQSAIYVGRVQMGDTDTDHFVYRTDGADYQLWIERGPRPLPHKIVVNFQGDPSRLSYSVDLDWTPNPTFKADTFRFVPPAGWESVAVEKVSPSEK